MRLRLLSMPSSFFLKFASALPLQVAPLPRQALAAAGLGLRAERPRPGPHRLVRARLRGPRALHLLLDARHLEPRLHAEAALDHRARVRRRLGSARRGGGGLLTEAVPHLASRCRGHEHAAVIAVRACGLWMLHTRGRRPYRRVHINRTHKNQAREHMCDCVTQTV